MTAPTHKRCRSARRQIRQPQLDALLALPAIHGNLAGSVQGTAAVFQERLAKRLTGSTKGNRIHKFSITGSKARTDMVLADRIGVDERMGWQRQQRFRIACSVGSGARQ